MIHIRSFSVSFSRNSNVFARKVNALCNFVLNFAIAKFA